jgi:putative PIN family toxin of toxin-antitoxin system
MEVIVDTNVFVNAILDQLNNEDCWEILRLVRCKQIKPVVSNGLLREYIFVPSKMGIAALEKKFNKDELDLKDFKAIQGAVYNCSDEMAKIMVGNCRMVEVTSKLKICDSDPDDDKIVNLAIDSNCHTIITKNINDLKCVEENGIKTKSGRQIEVMTPETFTQCFKLQRRFHNPNKSNRR